MEKEDKLAQLRWELNETVAKYHGDLTHPRVLRASQKLDRALNHLMTGSDDESSSTSARVIPSKDGL